ncbi:MAG: hypothetical protein GEV28_09140 [Actinophytocola sp.]|uniref:hypothetical protein n=1 Tax=Actinophytocola sp. TaxID=1872138 RepID=UPI001322A658|nr:hypothetical protein [Actinophytocola sp.]MPZ80539.1 hypothetical protein [Actinophytocola sp.]
MKQYLRPGSTSTVIEWFRSAQEELRGLPVGGDDHCEVELPGAAPGELDMIGPVHRLRELDPHVADGGPGS